MTVAAPVERLAGGLGFTEGPVWLAEHDALLFTDIPRNRILRWGDDGLSTSVQGSRFAIGLARHPDGRVLACEHVTRSLTAYEVRPDGGPGRREVLARAVAGVPLNSTNDVTVAPDGRVLFTDPPFGVREDDDGALVGYEQAAERPCDVLAVGADPDDAHVVVTGLYRPNGLVVTPDGGTLYVTDSSTRHHDVRVVPLDGGTMRVLWTMPAGVPRGVRLDVLGRLWVAGGDGVYVVTPDGRLAGHVPVPEMVTNLCFGGDDRTTLYVTATTGLYRTRTDVPGL